VTIASAVKTLLLCQELESWSPRPRTKKPASGGSPKRAGSSPKRKLRAANP
jgi:hypothetical protein